MVLLSLAAHLFRTPILKALGHPLLFNLINPISMLLVQDLLLRNGGTHHFPRSLVFGKLLDRLLPLLDPHCHQLLLMVTIGAVPEGILKLTREVTLGLVQAGIMTWQLMAQSRGHRNIALKLPTSIRILAFTLSP